SSRRKRHASARIGGEHAHLGRDCYQVLADANMDSLCLPEPARYAGLCAVARLGRPSPSLADAMLGTWSKAGGPRRARRLLTFVREVRDLLHAPWPNGSR